jgi:hypothetical protein
MSRAQCEVCGETKLDGWSDCPACGHPYPQPYFAADEADDEDEDDDDQDDGTTDDW